MDSRAVSLFFVILVTVINGQLRTEKRVIGGDVAPMDKYHWAVSLKGSIDKLNASGTCGASILKTEGSVRWLITAAHCFFPAPGISLLDPDTWHVRIGLRKVDFKYEKHKLKGRYENTLMDLHLKEIFVHPDYKHPRLENDIALMGLEEPLPIKELKNVDAIELPTETFNASWPKVDARCLVVGWGCTAAGGKVNPIAKLAVLNVWSNVKCEEAFNNPIDLNPLTEFCAGYRNKSYGLCQGDSGSALACIQNGKWKIAGIVSGVHRRRPGQYPALFTKVASFKEWIRSVTRIK